MLVDNSRSDMPDHPDSRGRTLSEWSVPRSASPGDTPASSARYELGALLGQGGMGLVYRAHDRGSDRQVALKIRRDTAPADAFEHEIRVVGARLHPALLPVFDAGHLADGRRFYTMPLVEAPTIREWLASGPEPRRAAARVAEVARALAALHLEVPPISHGDPSPANVLVTRDDRVYLIDFGQAGSDGPGRAGGTPGYQAPERGDGASPATDVFALGGLLALAVAGSPQGLPASAELRTLVELARAHDPAARPTAGLLAEELERWVAGDDLELHRYPLSERSRRVAVRRWRPLAGGALAVALVSLSGGAAWTSRLVDGARAQEAERGRAAAVALSEVRRDGDATVAASEARRSLQLGDDPDVRGAWLLSRARRPLALAGALPPLVTASAEDPVAVVGDVRVGWRLERPVGLQATRDGEPLWEVVLGDGRRTPGALGRLGSNVVVVHWDQVSALEPSTGAVVWSLTLEQPVDDPGAAVFGPDRAIFGNRRGSIWEVTADGRATGHLEVAPGGARSVVGTGPFAAFGDEGREVTFLSPELEVTALWAADQRVLALAQEPVAPHRVLVFTSDALLRVVARRPAAVVASAQARGATEVGWDVEGPWVVVEGVRRRITVPVSSTPRLHAAPTYRVRFDAKDDAVWSGGADGGLVRWIPGVGEQGRWRMEGGVYGLDALPEGGVVASTFEGGALFLPQEGRSRPWSGPGSTNVYRIAVQGDRLFAAGSSGTVAAWSWPDLVPVWATEPLRVSVMGLVPDGEGVAAMSLDGVLRIYDRDGRRTEERSSSVVLATGLERVSGGWVTGSKDGRVVTLLDDGTERSDPGHRAWPVAFASIDGGLATLGWDGTLALRDDAGVVRASIGENGVRWWDADRRGPWLAAGSSDGRLYVLDLDGWRR